MSASSRSRTADRLLSSDGASCQAPVADGQSVVTPTRTGSSELTASYGGDPLNVASSCAPPAVSRRWP
ncbi:MAG: hypothetical protein F2829_20005 [Actinobacteria bacterium]|nr:hypothetical protein [Actinomycetota bacterium]